MNRPNSTKTKWTIFGVLFGSLFPLAATLIKIQYLNTPFSWDSALQTQRSEQILWIVDLAPIVLGIIFHLIGTREYTLQQTNESLNNANQKLSELHVDLERLVMERTAELAVASEQAIKRANQLSTVADLSRSLASIKELGILLQETTRLVSQRMGYYHTGIFLLDGDKQFAIFRAASSEGGQKMLERGHRLKVGQTSIVGLVTSTGNPHITLETTADALYFDNPNLPQTRSEMALPLKAGDQVIGALDVQSTQPNAFSEEDLNILSTLADYVSSALENVRLHEETQNALRKAEIAYQQLTGEIWANVQQFAQVVGYRFDGHIAEPLTMPLKGNRDEALKEAFSIPLHLRGESIGTLRIRPTSEGHQWTDDEIAIIEATAERIALAAENARLVAESQKRASKEITISKISSKISEATLIDKIMATTVRELRQALRATEVSIQLDKEPL